VQERDWHEGAVIIAAFVGALALLAALGWFGWYLLVVVNPD
jgi:hypothetical protein